MVAEPKVYGADAFEQFDKDMQEGKGYRLHTISTTSSGSKGFMGGDKIQATMIFERIR